MMIEEIYRLITGKIILHYGIITKSSKIIMATFYFIVEK